MLGIVEDGTRNDCCSIYVNVLRIVFFSSANKLCLKRPRQKGSGYEAVKRVDVSPILQNRNRCVHGAASGVPQRKRLAREAGGFFRGGRERARFRGWRRSVPPSLGVSVSMRRDRNTQCTDACYETIGVRVPLFFFCFFLLQKNLNDKSLQTEELSDTAHMSSDMRTISTFILNRKCAYI